MENKKQNEKAGGNMKGKVMEYLRVYWGKKVFKKSVSLLVAVCFILNLANLPVFAQSSRTSEEMKRKEINIEEKQKNVVTNPIAVKPVNEQIGGVANIKADIGEAAKREWDRKDITVTAVGAILERSRDGKQENIIGSIDEKGKVQIFSADSSRPYSKKAEDEYVYRTEQVLESGVKSGQYVETHSKEYMSMEKNRQGVEGRHETKEITKVGKEEKEKGKEESGVSEGIKEKKVEQGVKKEEKQVVQREKVDEKSVQEKQNAIRALIKVKDTASVTKATIAKVQESGEKAGLKLVAEKNVGEEKAKIELYASKYTGESVYVGKAEGQMAYPTHNGSVEVREAKKTISIGGNEFEGTGVMLVRGVLGQEDDKTINKTAEGLFFAELLNIYDRNITSEQITKVREGLQVKEGKGVSAGKIGKYIEDKAGLGLSGKIVKGVGETIEKRGEAGRYARGTVKRVLDQTNKGVLALQSLVSKSAIRVVTGKKGEEGRGEALKEEKLEDTKAYANVVKKMMADTGQSEAEVKKALEAISSEQLSVLNDFYKEKNATIVNCATEALENVLKAGLNPGEGISKGMLALQALAVDIASGVFGKESVVNGNQLTISADAIQKVLAESGKDFQGYSSAKEGLQDALNNGGTAIVHVSADGKGAEDHFVTLQENKDGSVTIKDPNKDNATMSKEELGQYMKNTYGWESGTVLTDSKSEKLGTALDVSSMQQATGAKFWKAVKNVVNAVKKAVSPKPRASSKASPKASPSRQPSRSAYTPSRPAARMPAYIPQRNTPAGNRYNPPAAATYNAPRTPRTFFGAAIGAVAVAMGFGANRNTPSQRNFNVPAPMRAAATAASPARGIFSMPAKNALSGVLAAIGAVMRSPAVQNAVAQSRLSSSQQSAANAAANGTPSQQTEANKNLTAAETNARNASERLATQHEANGKQEEADALRMTTENNIRGGQLAVKAAGAGLEVSYDDEKGFSVSGENLAAPVAVDEIGDGSDEAFDTFVSTYKEASSAISGSGLKLKYDTAGNSFSITGDRVDGEIPLESVDAKQVADAYKASEGTDLKFSYDEKTGTVNVSGAGLVSPLNIADVDMKEVVSAYKALGNSGLKLGYDSEKGLTISIPGIETPVALSDIKDGDIEKFVADYERASGALEESGLSLSFDTESGLLVFVGDALEGTVAIRDIKGDINTFVSQYKETAAAISATGLTMTYNPEKGLLINGDGLAEPIAAGSIKDLGAFVKDYTAASKAIAGSGLQMIYDTEMGLTVTGPGLKEPVSISEIKDLSAFVNDYKRAAESINGTDLKLEYNSEKGLTVSGPGFKEPVLVSEIKDMEGFVEDYKRAAPAIASSDSDLTLTYDSQKGLMLTGDALAKPVAVKDIKNVSSFVKNYEKYSEAIKGSGLKLEQGEDGELYVTGDYLDGPINVNDIDDMGKFAQDYKDIEDAIKKSGVEGVTVTYDPEKGLVVNVPGYGEVPLSAIEDLAKFFDDYKKAAASIEGSGLNLEYLDGKWCVTGEGLKAPIPVSKIGDMDKFVDDYKKAGSAIAGSEGLELDVDKNGNLVITGKALDKPVEVSKIDDINKFVNDYEKAAPSLEGTDLTLTYTPDGLAVTGPTLANPVLVGSIENIEAFVNQYKEYSKKIAGSGLKLGYGADGFNVQGGNLAHPVNISEIDDFDKFLNDYKDLSEKIQGTDLKIGYDSEKGFNVQGGKLAGPVNMSEIDNWDDFRQQYEDTSKKIEGTDLKIAYSKEKGMMLTGGRLAYSVSLENIKQNGGIDDFLNKYKQYSKELEGTDFKLGFDTEFLLSGGGLPVPVRIPVKDIENLRTFISDYKKTKDASEKIDGATYHYDYHSNTWILVVNGVEVKPEQITEDGKIKVIIDDKEVEISFEKFNEYVKYFNVSQSKGWNLTYDENGNFIVTSPDGRVAIGSNGTITVDGKEVATIDPNISDGDLSNAMNFYKEDFGIEKMLNYLMTCGVLKTMNGTEPQYPDDSGEQNAPRSYTDTVVTYNGNSVVIERVFADGSKVIIVRQIGTNYTTSSEAEYGIKPNSDGSKTTIKLQNGLEFECDGTLYMNSATNYHYGEDENGNPVKTGESVIFGADGKPIQMRDLTGFDDIGNVSQFRFTDLPPEALRETPATGRGGGAGGDNPYQKYYDIMNALNGQKVSGFNYYNSFKYFKPGMIDSSKIIYSGVIDFANPENSELNVTMPNGSTVTVKDFTYKAPSDYTTNGGEGGLGGKDSNGNGYTANCTYGAGAIGSAEWFDGIECDIDSAQAYKECADGARIYTKNGVKYDKESGFSGADFSKEAGVDENYAVMPDGTIINGVYIDANGNGRYTSGSVANSPNEDKDGGFVASLMLGADGADGYLSNWQDYINPDERAEYTNNPDGTITMTLNGETITLDKTTGGVMSAFQYLVAKQNYERYLADNPHYNQYMQYDSQYQRLQEAYTNAENIFYAKQHLEEWLDIERRMNLDPSDPEYLEPAEWRKKYLSEYKEKYLSAYIEQLNIDYNGFGNSILAALGMDVNAILNAGVRIDENGGVIFLSAIANNIVTDMVNKTDAITTTYTGNFDLRIGPDGRMTAQYPLPSSAVDSESYPYGDISDFSLTNVDGVETNFKGYLTDIELYFGAGGKIKTTGAFNFVNTDETSQYTEDDKRGSSSSSSSAGNAGTPPKVDTEGTYDQTVEGKTTLSGQGAVLTFINGKAVLFGEGATAWDGSQLRSGAGVVTISGGEYIYSGGNWVSDGNAGYVYNSEVKSNLEENGNFKIDSFGEHTYAEGEIIKGVISTDAMTMFSGMYNAKYDETGVAAKYDFTSGDNCIINGLKMDPGSQITMQMETTFNPEHGVEPSKTIVFRANGTVNGHGTLPQGYKVEGSDIDFTGYNNFTFNNGDVLTLGKGIANTLGVSVSQVTIVNTAKVNRVYDGGASTALYEAGELKLGVNSYGNFTLKEDLKNAGKFNGSSFDLATGSIVVLTDKGLSVIDGIAVVNGMYLDIPPKNNEEDSDKEETKNNSPVVFKGDFDGRTGLVSGSFVHYNDSFALGAMFNFGNVQKIGSYLNKGSYISGLGEIDGDIMAVEVNGKMQWKGAFGQVNATAIATSNGDTVKKVTTIGTIYNNNTQSFVIDNGTKYTVNGVEVSVSSVSDGDIEVITVNKTETREVKNDATGNVEQVPYLVPEATYFVDFDSGVINKKLSDVTGSYTLGNNTYLYTKYSGETDYLTGSFQLSIVNSQDGISRGICGNVRTINGSDITLEGTPAALISIFFGNTENKNMAESSAEFEIQDGYVFITADGNTYSINDYKDDDSTSFLQTLTNKGGNYNYGIVQENGTVTYSHKIGDELVTLNYLDVGEGNWQAGQQIGEGENSYWFSYNGKSDGIAKDVYALSVTDNEISVNSALNDANFTEGVLKDDFLDRGEVFVQVTTVAGQPQYLMYKAGGAWWGEGGFKSAQESEKISNEKHGGEFSSGVDAADFGIDGKSPFTYMDGGVELVYDGKIYFEMDDNWNVNAATSAKTEIKITEQECAQIYYNAIKNNKIGDESIQMYKSVSKSEYEEMLAKAETPEQRAALEARFGYETTVEGVMNNPNVDNSEVNMTFGEDGYSDAVIVLLRDKNEVINEITTAMTEGYGHAYIYWESNNTKDLSISDLYVNVANFNDADGQGFSGNYKINSISVGENGALAIDATLTFNTGNGSIVLEGNSNKPTVGSGAADKNAVGSVEESDMLYSVGVDFDSNIDGQTKVTLKTDNKDVAVNINFTVQTQNADGTKAAFSLNGSVSNPAAQAKFSGFVAGTTIYAIKDTSLNSSSSQNFTNNNVDQDLNIQTILTMDKGAEIHLKTDTSLSGLNEAAAKAVEEGRVKTEGVTVKRIATDYAGNQIVSTISSVDMLTNNLPSPKWTNQYFGVSENNNAFAGGIYNADKNRVEFGFWDGHINFGKSELELDKNFFARAGEFIVGIVSTAVTAIVGAIEWLFTGGAGTSVFDTALKWSVGLVIGKQTKDVQTKDIVSVLVGIAVAVIAAVTTFFTGGAAAAIWAKVIAAGFTAVMAGMSAYEATRCFQNGDIAGGVRNSVFAIFSIIGGGALARSLTTIGAGIGNGLTNIAAKVFGKEAGKVAAKEAGKIAAKEAFKTALKETVKVAVKRGVTGAIIGVGGTYITEGIKNGGDFSKVDGSAVMWGAAKGFLIGASSAGFNMGLSRAGLMQVVSFSANSILINRSIEMAAVNISQGNYGAAVMDIAMALTYASMPIINQAKASAAKTTGGASGEQSKMDRSTPQEIKAEHLKQYEGLKTFGEKMNWHIENGVNVGLAMMSLNVAQTVSQNIMSGNNLFANLNFKNIVTMYAGGMIGGSMLSMAAPAFTRLWTTGNIQTTLNGIVTNPMQTLAGSLNSAINMTRFKAFLSPIYNAGGAIVSAVGSSLWEGITTGNWKGKSDLFTNPSVFFGGLGSDFKNAYINTLFSDLRTMSDSDIQAGWGQVRSSFGSAVFVSPFYGMATPGQAMFKSGSSLNNFTSNWAESGSIFRMIAGGGKLGNIFDGLPGLSNALNMFQFEVIGKITGGLGKTVDSALGMPSDYVSAEGKAVGLFEFVVSNASMLFVPSKLNTRAVSNYLQQEISANNKTVIAKLYDNTDQGYKLYGLTSGEIGTLQLQALSLLKPDLMTNVGGMQRILDRGSVEILGKNIDIKNTALYDNLFNTFSNFVITNLSAKDIEDNTSGKIIKVDYMIKVNGRQMHLSTLFDSMQNKELGVALFKAMDVHFQKEDIAQAGVLIDAVSKINETYKGAKFLNDLNGLESVKNAVNIERLRSDALQLYSAIQSDWSGKTNGVNVNKAQYGNSFDLYLLSRISGENSDVRIGLISRVDLGNAEVIKVLSSDAMKGVLGSYNKLYNAYIKTANTKANNLRDNSTDKFRSYEFNKNKGDLGAFTTKDGAKIAFDFQMVASLKFNLAHASIYGYRDGIASTSGIDKVFNVFFGSDQKVYNGQQNIGKTVDAFDANGKLNFKPSEAQVRALFNTSLEVVVGSNLAGGWGFSQNQYNAIIGIFDNTLMKAYSDKTAITAEDAHSMLKSINVLGTGEGKTAILAALFPVTKLVNDIKGERTIVCADIDTNVLGVMGRVQSLFGANYDVAKVDKDTIGNVSNKAALFMTYTDLGFIIVSDRQKGADPVLMNKIGVMLGDEADMAVYLSKVMISSSGGFEKSDSPMAKFFDKFATDKSSEHSALKSAVEQVQTLLMKDGTYKGIYDQLKRFQDGKTTVKDVRDIKKELTSLQGQIADKQVQDRITNILEGLGKDGRNVTGYSADMMKLLETAISINLNERTKILLSDQTYQVNFKGSYENIIKDLAKAVNGIDKSYGMNNLNGTGFALQEVLGNMLMAKLTWSNGVDYGIGKTEDGQNKVMLIKSGALIDLVPGVGFKQIIEAEMIKSGTKLGGITAIGDRDHSSIAIIDAIKNARGFIGLTGTYSASAQSAMGFNSNYYTAPTSLKLTGIESIIEKGEKGVVATILNPASTVFGAFEKPITTMLRGDSVLIMGMPTQAKIDLFKDYAQILGVMSKADAAGKGKVAWFDASMSKEDGQVFAKNKEGKYQFFIGTNEQLGRGVDIQIGKLTGIKKVELVIVDPHLSYKSAVEQLAGRVLGTRFTDQAQDVIPGTNKLTNINISIVTDMSTISTYSSKYENSMKLNGSTPVSAEQYLQLFNARVYGNDRSGREAEDAIVAQSGAGVSAGMNTYRPYVNTSVDLNRALTNIGVERSLLPNVYKSLQSRDLYNGFELRDTGSVAIGYALQLMGYDSNGQAIKESSAASNFALANTILGTNRAYSEAAPRENFENALTIVTKMQKNGLLAENMTNANSLNDILAMSDLIDSGVVEIKVITTVEDKEKITILPVRDISADNLKTVFEAYNDGGIAAIVSPAASSIVAAANDLAEKIKAYEVEKVNTVEMSESGEASGLAKYLQSRKEDHTGSAVTKATKALEKAKQKQLIIGDADEGQGKDLALYLITSQTTEQGKLILGDAENKKTLGQLLGNIDFADNINWNKVAISDLEKALESRDFTKILSHYKGKDVVVKSIVSGYFDRVSDQKKAEKKAEKEFLAENKVSKVSELSDEQKKELQMKKLLSSMSLSLGNTIAMKDVVATLGENTDNETIKRVLMIVSPLLTAADAEKAVSYYNDTKEKKGEEDAGALDISSFNTENLAAYEDLVAIVGKEDALDVDLSKLSVESAKKYLSNMTYSDFDKFTNAKKKEVLKAIGYKGHEINGNIDLINSWTGYKEFISGLNVNVLADTQFIKAIVTLSKTKEIRPSGLIRISNAAEKINTIYFSDDTEAEKMAEIVKFYQDGMEIKAAQEEDVKATEYAKEIHKTNGTTSIADFKKNVPQRYHAAVLEKLRINHDDFINNLNALTTIPEVDVNKIEEININVIADNDFIEAVKSMNTETLSKSETIQAINTLYAEPGKTSQEKAAQLVIAFNVQLPVITPLVPQSQQHEQESVSLTQQGSGTVEVPAIPSVEAIERPVIETPVPVVEVSAPVVATPQVPQVEAPIVQQPTTTSSSQSSIPSAQTPVVIPTPMAVVEQFGTSATAVEIARAGLDPVYNGVISAEEMVSQVQVLLPQAQPGSILETANICGVRSAIAVDKAMSPAGTIADFAVVLVAKALGEEMDVPVYSEDMLKVAGVNNANATVDLGLVRTSFEERTGESYGYVVVNDIEKLIIPAEGIVGVFSTVEGILHTGVITGVKDGVLSTFEQDLGEGSMFTGLILMKEREIKENGTKVRSNEFNMDEVLKKYGIEEKDIEKVKESHYFVAKMIGKVANGITQPKEMEGALDATLGVWAGYEDMYIGFGISEAQKSNVVAITEAYGNNIETINEMVKRGEMSEKEGRGWLNVYTMTRDILITVAQDKDDEALIAKLNDGNILADDKGKNYIKMKLMTMDRNVMREAVIEKKVVEEVINVARLKEAVEKKESTGAMTFIARVFKSDINIDEAFPAAAMENIKKGKRGGLVNPVMARALAQAA